MKRIVLVTAAVASLLMLAVACGDGYGSESSGKGGSSAQAPELALEGGGTTSSEIRNFRLQDLTVQVGGTVVWTQQDSTTHTTTSVNSSSPNGSWDSGNLGNGRSFSFTFTQAGTFPYFCTIHPSMTATITVVAPGSDGTTNQSEATQTSSDSDSGEIDDYD